jgi:perosamine synthetase
MIQPTRLTQDELRLLGHLLPGREPALARDTPRTGGVRMIIPVSEPCLGGNELRYLTRCVESNWISSAGPFVRDFEDRFAHAMGCAFGVACSSGTTALHLVLATLGLGPGDEVIIPTFTMIATANVVSWTGATPVLVDAEPQTWNMDPSAVEAKITDRTKAIIVVHTYGHPADMTALTEIARRHRLVVVEDAAEAHGAQYQGRPVGSLGAAAAFSFYGNKIVTTGEGGMVTTNDEALGRLARRLRDHAFSEERHFWHEYLGFSYRMTNLQAAVGLAQTERLDDLIRTRRVNRSRYEERLRAVRGLRLPLERPDVNNAFWMYGIVVEDDFGCTRDELREHLAREGIETRTFFVPIHLQPVYYRAYRGQAYPVAEALCRKGMYLPSGGMLSDAEIDTVAEAIVRAQTRHA